MDSTSVNITMNRSVSVVGGGRAYCDCGPAAAVAVAPSSCTTTTTTSRSMIRNGGGSMTIMAPLIKNNEAILYSNSRSLHIHASLLSQQPGDGDRPSNIRLFSQSATSSASSSSHENDNTTKPIATSFTPITPRRPSGNPLLEKYREAGRPLLDEMTMTLKSRRGNRLSLLEEDENHKPSVKQLRLASIVQEIMEDIVSDLEDAGDRSLCIGPDYDSLEIFAVEVSKDSKHARVHWTLPESLQGIWPRDKVMRATDFLQQKLQQKQKSMQHMLTMRIARAYAPRIRFVAMNAELSHSKEAWAERRNMARFLRMQKEQEQPPPQSESPNSKEEEDEEDEEYDDEEDDDDDEDDEKLER
jgi:ribosome-binding factor A